MYLLMELMQDEFIARIILAFGVWRFIGVPIWHHIETFPMVAHLLSYLPNLPILPPLPF